MRTVCVVRSHFTPSRVVGAMLGAAAPAILLAVLIEPDSEFSALNYVFWAPLCVVPANLVLGFIHQRLRCVWQYSAMASVACYLPALRFYATLYYIREELPIAWFAALLLGMVTGAIGVGVSLPFRRVIDQDGSLCPGCAYCLAGLDSQVCPECGRPFTYEELGTSKEQLIAAASRRAV